MGIVCYPTFGGSGVVATEMALELARRGHEVHLLSYARPARLPPHGGGVRYHEVQVTAYPLFRYPPYDLALAARMLELFQEGAVDIFHVHYAIPHAASAFLARSMHGGRLPFVTTLHGTDITVVGAQPAYAGPLRFALEASDAVTAVSRHLARQTHEAFGLSRPIHVVPNFVDLDRFRPGPGPRWSSRAGQERLVVHVSNMRPVKRVGDVARVFALLRREMPVRLALVGDGPDRDAAVELALEACGPGEVELPGEVEDTAEWLGRADLFLLPSEVESFGLALLEAMACGVPGVASRTGGIPELAGGCEGVRLCAVGDVEGMARQARGFLMEEEAWRAASRAARHRAEQSFPMGEVVDRYAALYEAVLAGP